MKYIAGSLMVLIISVISTSAYAACTNPAGVEGQQMYNATHDTMQFCDGNDWYDMKAIVGDTLSGLSCSDNEIAKWNNGASAWECAADDAGSGGDDLGSHEATQNVDLSTFKLVGNGGTEGIYITAAGLIGIGTTTPNTNAALEIYSTTGQDDYVVTTVTDNLAANPAIAFQKQKTTGGYLLDNSEIGSIQAHSYNGSNIGNGAFGAFSAMMLMKADGNHASGDVPGKIEFSTTPSGSTTPVTRMTIDSAGEVGIGTASPTDRLHVLETRTDTANALEAMHRNEMIVSPSAASLADFYANYNYIRSGNANSIDVMAGGHNYALYDDAGTATNVRGAFNYGRLNNASGTVTTLRGAQNYAQNAGGTATNLYGANNMAINNGTSNNVRGTATYARNDDSVGTGSVFGLHSYAQQFGNTGSITNAYGGYFDVALGSGATDARITNSYGVYIDTLNGTNKYGIYQEGTGDTNFFAGNIGIGTDTPGQELEISSNTLPGIRLRDANTLVDMNAFDAGAGQDSFLDFNLYPGTATDDAVVRFFRGTNTTGNVVLDILQGNSTATTNTRLSGNGDTYLNAVTGNVGIGKTNPSVELDVDGDINFTGTLTDTSDIRLKDNVTPLNETGALLDKVAKVDTISFTMKDDETGQVEYGVSAQQLETVFPDLVRTADDEINTKSVNYIGLIAPLIESIKELKAENEALRNRLEVLEKSTTE